MRKVLKTDERKHSLVKAQHVLALSLRAVSYTHLRAHETPEHLVCRLLLEKKNQSLGILSEKEPVVLDAHTRAS